MVTITRAICRKTAEGRNPFRFHAGDMEPKAPGANDP